MIVAASLAVAAVGLVPAAAQDEGPVWGYSVVDATGDQSANSCANAGTPSVCDIRSFELGTTSTQLHIRWTLGTLNFPPEATPGVLVVAFRFTGPDEKAYGAQRGINPTGTQGVSFSGDPPNPPGVAWTVDRAKGTVTATVDLEGIEGVPGSELSLTSVSTAWCNAYAAVTGLFWTGVDSVPLNPKTFVIPASSAEAEGAVVPLTLFVEKDFLEVNPGASATFPLTVTNGDSMGHNVTLNATGGLSATFDPAELALSGGASANSTVTIDVPSDAPVDSEVPVTFHGYVGDVEAVNLTITVKVVEEAEASAAPSASGAANSTAAAGSGKAAPSTEAGGVPGFETVVGMLAVGLALAWRRRVAQ